MTAAPIRVLHFAAGNLYGGVESQLLGLAECQAEGLAPGLEMEFAVCFEGRLADVVRATSAAVHHVGGVRFSRPWTAWRARRSLARLLDERSIDVVIGHACWPYLLAGPVALRSRRPLVFWAHDHLGGPHWIERLAGSIRPHLALANSQCTADTVPRRFPGVPIEVIHNVVSPAPFDALGVRALMRAEMGVSESDVVIVTACRLERWKGHALLLEALGRLAGKAGWLAWIAGGAQRPHEQVYLDELKVKARAFGIEGRVRFLGQRDDVRRLLAAADVHCQPNTSPEPFGIAFVEALYAALPVVSTRMGGAEEIVTNACGVLVPPADPAALGEAIVSLIDDPRRRSSLGSIGPDRAAALCSPAVVLPELERVLRQVVAEPSKRSAPPLTTSVLIPSFRRSASLEACLNSLTRQTVFPDEALIVWQGDDSPTRDQAARLAGVLPFPVRVLHLDEPGIVPAENLALAAASGELILLIDDDAVAPPDWVERHLRHYADPTVGAVGGSAINYQEGRPLPINGRTPIGRITRLGRFVGNMHDQPDVWRNRRPFEADHLVGYNMSLRRSAFDRFESGLRRYWQMFEAEACLQVRARGFRVLFDPGMVVDHFLTPRTSVYEGGRGGDLDLKVGNAAYNTAFILSKHSRVPLRWARWAFLTAVGTTQSPGPLLLPRAVLRYGGLRREIAVARLALRRRLEGWRDGRLARSTA